MKAKEAEIVKKAIQNLFKWNDWDIKKVGFASSLNMPFMFFGSKWPYLKLETDCFGKCHFEADHDFEMLFYSSYEEYLKTDTVNEYHFPREMLSFSIKWNGDEGESYSLHFHCDDIRFCCNSSCVDSFISLVPFIKKEEEALTE